MRLVRTNNHFFWFFCTAAAIVSHGQQRGLPRRTFEDTELDRHAEHSGDEKVRLSAHKNLSKKIDAKYEGHKYRYKKYKLA